MARLDQAYGRPTLAPRLPPVGELVYTVLSQNTSDVNTDRTYAALRRRFPTWAEVREAPVEEVETGHRARRPVARQGAAHRADPARP